MHKIILILTVTVTMFGCSMPDSDMPVSQAPVASTTATPEITPTPVETLAELVSTPVATLPQVVPTPLPKLPEQLTVPTQTLPKPAVSVPTKVKSSLPVANTTSTSQFNAVASSDEKQISTIKLVENIRKNIGCGKVDEEYKTQVMAIAIAQSNPKATQKLTENQFYQAVRQTIAENQAQANNVVAQYRASNCGIALKQQSKDAVVKSTSTNNIGLVPEQSGSCKDLAAKGIKNINVALNPWASRLDRDDDGVACETN